MKFTYAFTTVLATALATAKLEIAGGKEATMGQHLYVTSLRWRAADGTMCGGSLIAPNVVLTAAHCLSAQPRYVAIGSHFRIGTQDGEQIKIKESITHPKYNKTLGSNDLAILTLERASIFPPVEVSFDEVATGTPTIVRGWGLNSKRDKFSNILLEVGVDTFANSQCAKFLAPNIVDEFMLCAKGKFGEDPCDGDSGGPLTIEANGTAKLVGVVSWGRECGRVNTPSVYSRISAARGFIEPYLTGEDRNSTALPTDAASLTPTPSSDISIQCNGCTGCTYPPLKHCFPSYYDKVLCTMMPNVVWCGN
ncbi:Aste57867_15025 [Aphanomyces stellatus]|uniref:Aste57867_15025 protein n=1 Tax=Aphanomyces stellatus TaxID=120398 RepID=A0A485KGJ4_9STRA|nr:hypothetical protein As57867_014969 [Aphanomyces stellatus]KAF0711463.1 hypothetical protein As57867_005247 [Aphanomyces stellatus]KAF0712661.1 hypothetical protein As57867_004721 [Aphanomyces stellatus]VFT81830.1 Aste57867_4734 [Aphanomyces stellatus]VFT82330.1 Aste57867_5260 [Aphanomyces stellatus]